MALYKYFFFPFFYYIGRCRLLWTTE